MKAPIIKHSPKQVLLAATSIIALLGSMTLAMADSEENVKDEEVTEAIENEFIFDAAVPYNDIDVETTDGIVELTGRVANILAKERATTIAETVKGVRSVVNRIDVRPYFDLKAKQLADEVENALLEDPAADSYEIQTEAKDDGTVTLTGTVDSWQEKQLAAKVAKGVRGVTELQNNIDVDYEVERPDVEIETEIERKLDWDVLVDDALIDVDVDDGAVSLSGKVGSAAEKRQARNDAYVSGVESVNVEKLEVERWMRDEDMRKQKYVPRADSKIKQAIEDALLYDPRALSFDITAKVSSGLVTLKGVVDNMKAKRAAEQVARGTVGVLGVTNKIKVRPVVEELSDETIEENVEAKLALNPWVESYEIDANVTFGTAHLFGTVDNQFEKAEASSVAQGVEGVTEVRNHLEVSDISDRMVYDPYAWDTTELPWEFYPYTPPAEVAATTFKPDEEILEDVKDEIFWSPFVDSEDVAVTVDDGIVTLEGVVDSLKEKQAATENAFEGGAASVDNDLIVKS